jgi:hypothetical protein
VIALLTVGLVAADQGGYFPTAWGWGALGALLPLSIWLVIGRPTEARRLDVLFIAALSLLAGWTALSIAWSDSAARSVLDTERVVLYVSALAAVLLLARKPRLHVLVGAVLLAILLLDLYSLSTRLFPDRLGVFDPISTYRLSQPVGYWNGLGILTAIGILLALGFAARGRKAWIRIGSAASLPILLPTLYFTFSRGAWIALGIGLACALAYDARRLQLASWLLMLAPAPAIATLLAADSHALTHTDVPLGDAVDDGHRLALAVLLLVPATSLCALALIFLERRVRPPRSLRLVYGGALLAVPVVGLVLVFAHYGGPVEAVSRAYDSFKSPPAKGSSNLNKRLLSLTSNGRIDLWKVAWQDYEEHPAVGSGAGTFARYWFRTRPAPGFTAQDAHGVYIETLAELGPVGLAALVAALLMPLFAATRARREPVAALLLGAYLAFVVHAGVDWDFELPGVSLAGLLCGAALVIAARREPFPRPLSGPARSVGVVVTVALTGFALLGLIGNSALSASEDARTDRNWTKAEEQARKARRLMPWSPDPFVALGTAQFAHGDAEGARVSFRRAVAKDPGDWVLWFKLSAVTAGVERRAALARARRLNPLGTEIGEIRTRPG